uniref:rhomboid family intramembrane serine protease n=1 Tax=Flavobacterium sp. TaxID=239 RepID=UPI0040499D98
MITDHKNTPFQFSTSVVAWPLYFVLSMWFVFWIQLKFNLRFYEFGIFPRTLSGLRGVFLSPFIHGNLEHLYNNSIPLLLLIAALRYFYRVHAFKVLVYGVLFSGLLTWLFARPSYHIGASGLVYVLVSFIFFKGIFTQYYRLVALSLIIVFVYGSLIWYVFPDVKEGISWEGHLAGFLVGFVFSLVFDSPTYQKPIKYDWEHPDFDPSQDSFMKHFDENGNFVIKKDEEVIAPTLDNWFQHTENFAIQYEIKPTIESAEKDDKEAE